MDQRFDDRLPVFLHEGPQLRVDRHALRLDPGDGLGAVLAPVHDEAGIDGGAVAIAGYLSPQQFR